MVGCSSHDFIGRTSNIKYFAIGRSVRNSIDATRDHLCIYVSFISFCWIESNFIRSIWENKSQIALISVKFVFITVAVPVWWHHSSIIISWHCDTHPVEIHTIATCSMNFDWPLNHLPIIHECLHLVKSYCCLAFQLSNDWHQPLHKPNINVHNGRSHCAFIVMHSLF